MRTGAGGGCGAAAATQEVNMQNTLTVLLAIENMRVTSGVVVEPYTIIPCIYCRLSSTGGKFTVLAALPKSPRFSANTGKAWVSMQLRQLI
jgi:hypothetical protein